MTDAPNPPSRDCGTTARRYSGRDGRGPQQGGVLLTASPELGEFAPQTFRQLGDEVTTATPGLSRHRLRRRRRTACRRYGHPKAASVEPFSAALSLIDADASLLRLPQSPANLTNRVYRLRNRSKDRCAKYISVKVAVACLRAERATVVERQRAFRSPGRSKVSRFGNTVFPPAGALR
jgi:hypothetical protein